MKKLKRIAALMLVLVQLFLLCGCTELDKMRHNQAFHGEGTDILWDGATYKLLPTSDLLCPEMDYERTVLVTESDVPVLLSPFLAHQRMYASADGLFLEPVVPEDGYFCRADKYEEICARLRNFTPDKVCYRYGVFDEETWEYNDALYTLTEEQVEVLELITSTVEPEVQREGWSLDYDWSVMLEECSEDMLICRSELDILRSGRTYYLMLYTDSETLVFTVPTGCNDQLDAITEAYLSSWEYEYTTEDDVI